MLNVTLSPQQKRQNLRDRLSSGDLIQIPGVHSPLVARQAEAMGFSAGYLSGGALSAELGYPDIGLTTLTEVSQRGYQIARATNLPIIIDADTGFGEVLNVVRTIRELEQLGIAGCHLEDQENPKRCGHLDGKSIISTDAMCDKIRAASTSRHDPNFLLIARTDARAVEGLEGAIARAKAYLAAGADAIFPEAMANMDEFKAFRAAVDVPLLANMTEFGKSELFSKETLASAGIQMVIYPVTTLRSAMGATHRVLEAIKTEGSQLSQVPHMLTRADLYELLDYSDYNAFDQSIFNFKVSNNGTGKLD